MHDPTVGINFNPRAHFPIRTAAPSLKIVACRAPAEAGLCTEAAGDGADLRFCWLCPEKWTSGRGGGQLALPGLHTSAAAVARPRVSDRELFLKAGEKTAVMTPYQAEMHLGFVVGFFFLLFANRHSLGHSGEFWHCKWISKRNKNSLYL